MALQINIRPGGENSAVRVHRPQHRPQHRPAADHPERLKNFLFLPKGTQSSHLVQVWSHHSNVTSRIVQWSILCDNVMV